MSHIQVVDDGSVICRCGNVGCLEALAGGGALGRAGEAAALAGASPRLQTATSTDVTAADVARAASFGDPVAVGMLQDAGRRVGLVLASIVNFFNPSLIVVGGGVAQSGDQLLASIRETVYRRSLPLAATSSSSVRRWAPWRGSSATMVVDQLFSRESMARWRQADGPSAILDAARAAEDEARPGDLGDDVDEVAGVGILQDQLLAPVGQDLPLDDDLAIVRLGLGAVRASSRRATRRARPAPRPGSSPIGSRRPSPR